MMQGCGYRDVFVVIVWKLYFCGDFLCLFGSAGVCPV